MPKAAPLQSSFGAGEFSPRLFGCVDQDRYKEALETCLNWVSSIQGSLLRRPGTSYVYSFANFTQTARLIPFKFSNQQAYIFMITGAAGGTTCQVNIFANGGLVALSSFAIPYAVTDLHEIRFTQNIDVMYLAHKNYPPGKILRTSSTAFSYQVITAIDGPYLGQNSYTSPNSGGSQIINFDRYDNISLTGAAAGSFPNFTLTASQAIFQSSDVGRAFRVESASAATYGVITGFTSSTVVSWQSLGGVHPPAPPFTANQWRFGAWCSALGYPSNVIFHEDRLVFLGGNAFPERFDGSNSSDYENFAPTQPDETVIDSNAYSFSLNSNDVNALYWGVSSEQGMVEGSAAGEWIVRPSTQGEAISPTNISAKNVTSFGSEDVQAVAAGKAIMFVQRGATKIRELLYDFYVEGFRGTDVTELSEHITGTGIQQMVYVQNPQPILWCLRIDGTLVGMTYDRDAQNLRVGWHRHQLGGSSDIFGTPPIILSIATIPSPDNSYDQLWMLVQRNGSVSVEYLNNFFKDTDDQKTAIYVDCANTYDNPLPVVSFTSGAQMELQVTGHGLAVGDTVVLKGLGARSPTNVDTANNKLYSVTEIVDANNFRIDLDTSTLVFDPNTSKYSPTIRKRVHTISGLDYLDGQTVSVLGDGAVLKPQVVESGSITLSSPAATVVVGLGYNSDMQMLPLEAGSQDGTAMAKTRRTQRVGVMLYKTGNFSMGFSFSGLFPVPTRTMGQNGESMGYATPLYSGLISENISSNYDFKSQICIRQNDPLPGSILAVAPQLVEQDRG